MKEALRALSSTKKEILEPGPFKYIVAAIFYAAPEFTNDCCNLVAS